MILYTNTMIAVCGLSLKSRHAEAVEEHDFHAGNVAFAADANSGEDLQFLHECHKWHYITVTREEISNVCLQAEPASLQSLHQLSSFLSSAYMMQSSSDDTNMFHHSPECRVLLCGT